MNFWRKLVVLTTAVFALGFALAASSQQSSPDSASSAIEERRPALAIYGEAREQATRLAIEWFDQHLKNVNPSK